MSAKNGKSAFRVDDQTAALLGPSHVQDLTAAVSMLTGAIRHLDDTIRETSHRNADLARFQLDAMRELIGLLKSAKPAQDLSPNTEIDP